MLQWFLRFPEFTEFLFYLGKSQMFWFYVNVKGESQHLPKDLVYLEKNEVR